MKKKGMTLVESIITVAPLGVIFLLVTPVINSFGKVKNRVKTQKKIDREFSNTSDFIQRKIRAAKKTGSSSGGIGNPLSTYVGVYSSFEYDTDPATTAAAFFDASNKKSDGDEGYVLFLEVPDSSGDPEFNFFIFDENKLKYRVGFDGTNETLMDGVENVTFKLKEGIVVYYIDLNIDDLEGKLRDSLRSSASTRIDIQ